MCSLTETLRSPVAVKGEACEDQQKADGAADGAVDPDVHCESEGAGNENSWHPGVTPAAIWPGQIGLGAAHTEERDYRETVENPTGKDKEIGQLLKCSGERHQAGEHALKNQCAGRRAKFRVDAVGNLEEDAVARHGVGDASAAQDRRIHGADCGYDHCQGNPASGATACNVFDNIRSDVPR